MAETEGYSTQCSPGCAICDRLSGRLLVASSGGGGGGQLPIWILVE